MFLDVLNAMSYINYSADRGEFKRLSRQYVDIFMDAEAAKTRLEEISKYSNPRKANLASRAQDLLEQWDERKLY